MSEQPTVVYQQVSSTNDFAKHFTMAMIFLLITCAMTGTGIYGGYKVGCARGDSQGYARAIKEHPPQMITGPNARIETVYNNAQARFRISAFPFCVGWRCE